MTQNQSSPDRVALLVHRDHRRTYQDNVYVYPVVSRRSKGVSIGINLNPDKICNFDCVYCQVDRSTPGPTKEVNLEQLRIELADMIDFVQSGAMFQEERFSKTPEALRRLNDFAFSGDGEPTTCPKFAEVVQMIADLKQEYQLANVKSVLITNATRFHDQRVQHGLKTLQQSNGEVWAKLEAGTEEYYQRIERTTVPYQRILDNITTLAKEMPIVIQALFMRLAGEPPSEQEQLAFCDRLNEVQQAGGTITLVQIYTVARRPAEEYVTPLSAAEVDALVELVEQRTGLSAEPFYGPEE